MALEINLLDMKRQWNTESLLILPQKSMQFAFVETSFPGVPEILTDKPSGNAPFFRRNSK